MIQILKKRTIFFLLILFLNLNFIVFAGAKNRSDTSAIIPFIKEINNGLVFKLKNEREELRSDTYFEKEELFTIGAAYQIENNFYNILEYKQEMLGFQFDAGTYYGTGDWLDSTENYVIDAENTEIGIRLNLGIDFESRYYYDRNNFTLVQLNAWARNDLFHRSAEGTELDSNQMLLDFKDKNVLNKTRYGFLAKAGWGLGRLNPVNHKMVAEYILDKYYKGRVFSDIEIVKLAKKIAEIKHNRLPKLNRKSDDEISELVKFLSTELLLNNPELNADWELGEFLPRWEGKRFEMGPFFNYYNLEPDFYYGGYMEYKKSDYKNVNWNRNLSINANYNHYKQHDWVTLEANLGWSYFANIKSQFDFGLKYIPGMIVHDWDDMEPVRHNFIPYVSYYSQLNSKSRLNFTFAWKIGDGEDFLQTGPELTLEFYSSKY